MKTSFENFMMWGLKEGILIDAYSGPLRFGSRSQEEFTFIHNGSGHTVIDIKFTHEKVHIFYNSFELNHFHQKPKQD